MEIRDGFVDAIGNTPLVLASWYSGAGAAIEKLIANGADVGTPGSDGMTALVSAAIEYALVRALVVSPQPFFSPRGTPFSVWFTPCADPGIGIFNRRQSAARWPSCAVSTITCCVISASTV